jgi:hypothetical protein
MGMFDEIQFEKKLPLPIELKKIKGLKWKETVFQTKDLDCLMQHYRVNSRGQLLLLQQEREWVEDNSRFGGHVNILSEEWIKSSHTGNVHFYTDVCSNPEQKQYQLLEFVPQEQIDAAYGYNYFVEFRAQFVNGKLLNIEHFQLNSYPIKKYLIDHNEWLTEVKIKESKFSYKLKKLLWKRTPLKKVIKILNKFISLQQTLVSKLY